MPNLMVETELSEEDLLQHLKEWSYKELKEFIIKVIDQSVSDPPEYTAEIEFLDNIIQHCNKNL